MSIKTILLLSCLILSSVCFLKTKKFKGSMSASTKEGDILTTYEDMIYTKLNAQRVSTSLPKLQRLIKLNQLAKMEATEIATEQNFGTHTKFQAWADSTPYNYFTEISVQIIIEGITHQDVEMIANQVVDAIVAQQNWYMSHEESFGGIKMVRDKITANNYIIVVHMLKDLGYYRHCQDALFFEDYSSPIQIYNTASSQSYSAECDQLTDNGGWTELLNFDKNANKSLIADVPDFGFGYTELLWIAKNGYFMDLTQKFAGDWDFDGFCFAINMIQMGGYFYVSEEIPTHSIVPPAGMRGSGFQSLVEQVKTYNLASIQILESASTCKFSNETKSEYCAKSFIMGNLPGKITKITDVESISLVDNSDNIYKYHFHLYVR